MLWIAWRMLTFNTVKYLGIVLGVAFASFLIAQQASIFCGLMILTSSQINDVRDAAIWVMDPNVEFIDDIKPMSDTDLQRVRGVPGIAWAVPLYKGLNRARLPDGNYQQVILLGIDDAALVGAPRTMFLGKVEDLKRPDAVIMDRRGYELLWPGEPLTVGKTLEMNDRRAVIVGVCDASKTFQTFPVVYTRYSQATLFSPRERKLMSFVLAETLPGVSTTEACRRIREQTELAALTRDEFSWATIDYYMRKTGIPINFGITVILGFIVGTAIAGQTFYLFTVENLKQFGTLKALGTSDLVIVSMVMFQAVVVGLIGYGIGIGMAGVFGMLMKDAARLAFYMPWQVPVITAAAVTLIVILASLLSIHRVLVLEPAAVFRA